MAEPTVSIAPKSLSTKLFSEHEARAGDLAMRFFTSMSAITIVLMLGAVLFVLIHAAISSVEQYGSHFRSGALPSIYGTIISSAIAIALAVPLSLAVAIFIVRIAPRFLVTPISFLIEFLATIPSIAFGVWGMFVLWPLMMRFIQHWPMHEMICAGMILAIMVIPIITAISRDVLWGVPLAHVEATVALGATWWQCAKQMLRFSRRGILGAIVLGLARAAGETMAVTMVIGNLPRQTMTSLLARNFADATEINRSTLLEVALILLAMSLIFNVVARSLVVGKYSRGAVPR